MKLIVGLGNPGPGYANSLHNLGFMSAGHFARSIGIQLNKRRSNARIGQGKIGDIDILVATPHTYMNKSGDAVSKLAKKYKVGLDDLIVIYDDMDLPLGKIRVRPGGSSGGHKGVESIISKLGSQDFPRVRVGIGRPIASEITDEVTDADIITYLLSELPSEEKCAITQILPVISEAIFYLITEGVTAAMNKYN